MYPHALHSLLNIHGVACSQCSEADCCTAFHVLCAHKAGCHCSLTGLQGAVALCLRHSPATDDAHESIALEQPL